MPDFVVTPALLNRRSGPSLDDPVVEVLPRDKMISGSDQGDGWVRTMSADGATYAMARYLRELTEPRAQAIGVYWQDLGAGEGVNVPIGFPAGRFQGLPQVYLSLANESWPENTFVSVSNANAAGALLRLTRVNEGRTRVNWLAVEGGS